MKTPCAGCRTTSEPAAYAIMHERDLAKIKKVKITKGPRSFHAAPVCQECFTNPANRKRKLKAHFSMPQDLKRMLAAAGSSSSIGG